MITNIDTSAFGKDQKLYLDPDKPGGLTATPPMSKCEICAELPATENHVNETDFVNIPNGEIT